MILNIVSNNDPENIKRILEEDINLRYFKVTYRKSYGHKIHEFFVDDRTDEEVCLSLENLQEIAADLMLHPWDLRIIVIPKEQNNE